MEAHERSYVGQYQSLPPGKESSCPACLCCRKPVGELGVLYSTDYDRILNTCSIRGGRRARIVARQAKFIGAWINIMNQHTPRMIPNQIARAQPFAFD